MYVPQPLQPLYFWCVCIVCVCLPFNEWCLSFGYGKEAREPLLREIWLCLSYPLLKWSMVSLFNYIHCVFHVSFTRVRGYCFFSSLSGFDKFQRVLSRCSLGPRILGNYLEKLLLMSSKPFRILNSSSMALLVCCCSSVVRPSCSSLSS